MSDIFISYAREDRMRVRLLADALSAHGWSVWWDRQIQAGKAFDDVITDALASAYCVVVVWSSQSIASSWVREEAEEGRRRGILIPVLIDEARPPLGFGRIQAADLGDWTGTETSDAFQKLVEDITAIIGPPDAQSRTKAAVPPVKPQAGAAASGTSGAPSTIDAAPPSMIAGRGEVVVEPHVVSVPEGKNAAGRAGQTQRASRTLTLGYFDTSGKRVRWSLAAAFVLIFLAFGLYRLKSAEDGSSQPPPTMEPSTESALQLNAVMTEGGQPLTSGVQYDVYEAAKDADGKRKPVISSPAYKEPPTFHLAAGSYYVMATYGSATAEMDVVVTAAKVTHQTLNLRAGSLSLTSILSAGSQPLTTGVQYDVYEAAKDADGKRKPVISSPAYKEPPTFHLSAGSYHVTATYGNATAEMDVFVTAAESTRQALDLRAGSLSLTSVLTAGSQPLTTGVQYDVFEAKPDVDGKRKPVISSPAYKEPPTFHLSAGSYYVTATYGNAPAEMEVVVKAAEMTRQTLDLRAGSLSLTSVLTAGSQPLTTGVQYDVFEAKPDVDGKRKFVISSPAYKEPPIFPLLAGSYYVTASSNVGEGDSEVTISAGGVSRVQLRLSPQTDRH
jgi:hypothetical protein